MAVPTRVRRGTSGNDIYYWDGVNPMTSLGGGIGDIMNNSSGLNIPLVSMSTTDFDNFRQYLIDRKSAFDAVAACAVCPITPDELTSFAQSLVGGISGGG